MTAARREAATAARPGRSRGGRWQTACRTAMRLPVARRAAGRLARAMCALLAGVAAVLIDPAGGDAASVLRASHQWPERMGDLRDEMLRSIADDVAKAHVGLRIEIFPNGSLVAAREQWAALSAGRIDITLLPLDYASDQHPEFGATLMPTLVRNHEHARRLSASPFMEKIRRIIAQDGIFVLADGWLAGGFASRNGCILEPKDVSGLQIRTAGTLFETMLAAAGARPVPIALDDVFAAMAAGTLDVAVTSSESLVSMRLYRQAACVTLPGDSAVWFMYEPILMLQRAFDRLTGPQQAALLAAARKAETFGYERAAFSDEVLEGVFGTAGVRKATMTAAQAAAWRTLAERTAFRAFAERVEQGDALLKAALAVP